VNLVDKLILSVKRRESPPARVAHDVYRWLERWRVPENEMTRALYRTLYYAHDMYEGARELVGGKLVFEPMVRARVHSVGEGTRFAALPYIVGHAKITIGANCTFNYFKVDSGHFVDEPELVIGDRCYFSTGVIFSVNQRITLGNNIGVAAGTVISDSGNHPSDAEARARGDDMSVDEIAPVTIEDNVWIGRNCQIHKGVTIGRGAVVAGGSVVVSDVPAGALAMGVPARFVKQPVTSK
jgi:acetyltransferase-like isoleucine patch superfamily enzyme